MTPRESATASAGPPSRPGLFRVMRVALSALKPGSWPKLLVPMVLGQTLGAAEAGRLSLGGLATGVAFTAADAVFIVLSNDWADREVDALKRRLFPSAGSPKTIP